MCRSLAVAVTPLPPCVTKARCQSSVCSCLWLRADSQNFSFEMFLCTLDFVIPLKVPVIPYMKQLATDCH